MALDRDRRSPRARSALLSPLNKRRWRNFKANRRGYWSLWIFLALFVVSLFAEFIANDRPILARYKGELLVPVLVDYPESKFGGFLAVTDYKDPVILDEIEKNGWAIWPPIGYSYTPINKDYPRVKDADGQCLGFPGAAALGIEQRRCARRPPSSSRATRPSATATGSAPTTRAATSLARLIYGFRISVLFGLLLTILSSRRRRHGRRRAGLFRRPRRSHLPALPRDLVVDPVAVRAASSSPRCWCRASGRCSACCCCSTGSYLVGVVRAEFLRGRNFEYITAARALGPVQRQDHVQAPAAERDGGDADVPALQAVGLITALTALDFLGLGLPPGSPSLGELLLQGKANLQAPWLGLAGFFSDRRSCCRC